MWLLKNALLLFSVKKVQCHLHFIEYCRLFGLDYMFMICVQIAHSCEVAVRLFNKWGFQQEVCSYVCCYLAHRSCWNKWYRETSSNYKIPGTKKVVCQHLNSIKPFKGSTLWLTQTHVHANAPLKVAIVLAVCLILSGTITAGLGHHC